VSTGNELLADIQRIFESKKGVTKISTYDLISELIADDELPWATYNRGKAISPRQLSKQLSFYGIKSKTVRFGTSTPKGYEFSQFEDAFARYLTPPEDLPQQCIVLPKSNTGEAPHVADAEKVAETETTDATPNSLLPIDCGGVSDESPTPGDATEEQLEDLF
jgi:putative DNA primase/helicase